MIDVLLFVRLEKVERRLEFYGELPRSFTENVYHVDPPEKWDTFGTRWKVLDLGLEFLLSESKCVLVLFASGCLTDLKVHTQAHARSLGRKS